MNTFEATQFNARSARISSADNDFEAWAFSIQEDRLILCCEDYTTVILTPEEQRKIRSAQSWSFLLIAKGMISPAAQVIGGWMAYHQQSPEKNTASNGEAEGKKVSRPSKPKTKKQCSKDEKS